MTRKTHNGRLHLHGVGEVAALPDTAYIYATVSASDENTGDALAECNSKMADLQAQLVEMGIDQQHIATTNFSVRPVYRVVDKRQTSEIEAWIVSNSIAVKVIELENLGILLTLAGGYGKVGGPHFSNSRYKDLQNECRTLAIKDAIAKAKLYCTAAECDLVGIVEINETNYGRSYGGRENARMSACCDIEGAPPAPIEAGEQTISLSVALQFEIKNNLGSAKAEN
jgi:hypothetical protein